MEGGHFRVRPWIAGYKSKQMYFPDTAVLITRFITEAGSARSWTSCPRQRTSVIASIPAVTASSRSVLTRAISAP
jgi:hypothetical protein